MPKKLDEQLVVAYMKDYMDLVEELPNDLSRMLSQLHNNNDLDKLLVKLNRNLNKLIRSKSIKHQIKYKNKLQVYLIKMQHIYDQRVKVSQKILEKIQSKGRELAQDYEGILLGDQIQSFTYGTRSGRLWTSTQQN